jgi:hypothetical protein
MTSNHKDPSTMTTHKDTLLELADRLYPVLRDFPADGQLRSLDQNTLTDLLLAGFIERREVKKPCKTCGTERYDYAYFHITGGGRLFMALAARAAQ